MYSRACPLIRLYGAGAVTAFLLMILWLALTGGYANAHDSVESTGTADKQSTGNLTSGTDEGQVIYLYLPFVIRSLPQLLEVVISNGDFEKGPVGWGEFSTVNQGLIRSTTDLPITPYSGDWAASLGNHNDEVSMLSQGVTISPDYACLVYWQWIVSADTCDADYGGVGINGKWVDVQPLCVGTSTARWLRRQVSMTLYSTAVTKTATVLNFAVVNDYSIPSTLYVDDVSFQPTEDCTVKEPETETEQAAIEWQIMHRSLIGQSIRKE